MKLVAKKATAAFIKGAFAMMVTLVWLYIEFLRLLSNLRSK